MVLGVEEKVGYRGRQGSMIKGHFSRSLFKSSSARCLSFKGTTLLTLAQDDTNTKADNVKTGKTHKRQEVGDIKLRQKHTPFISAIQDLQVNFIFLLYQPSCIYFTGFKT